MMTDPNRLLLLGRLAAQVEIAIADIENSTADLYDDGESGVDILDFEELLFSIEDEIEREKMEKPNDCLSLTISKRLLHGSTEIRKIIKWMVSS